MHTNIEIPAHLERELIDKKSAAKKFGWDLDLPIKNLRFQRTPAKSVHIEAGFFLKIFN